MSLKVNICSQVNGTALGTSSSASESLQVLTWVERSYGRGLLLRLMFLASVGCWLMPCANVSAQRAEILPNSVNAAQPTLTLKTGTNLVVEDVTVTDSNGKPVHGLKAQDFVLTEDGRAQRIRNFVEHQASNATNGPAVAPQKLSPGIFTNHAEKNSEGPVNILLLDMLNTPLRDQQYARQQIQHFLDRGSSGAQIAVFGLGSRLTLLQGFTGDYSLLRSALARKRATNASSLLDDSLGGGGSGNNSSTGVSEALADNATAPDAQELVANAKQFEADSASFQLGLRTVFTLDALSDIARYLSNIPGRKNLIWFSSSFPVDLLPSTSTANGFASMSSHEEELQKTINLLARTQIALYPVDVRGLQTTDTFNAATQSTRYNRDATTLGKDIANFDAQIGAENSAMVVAARETGGRAFINTNDLTAATAAVIEDGVNYYTVTYTPAANTAAKKDRFRKINVSLPGKPYALSFRRGYYAFVPLAGEPSIDDNHPQSAAPFSDGALTRSMMRGVPAPTQIEFTVRVRPVTGRVEATVAQGNEPVKERAATGPFLRLAVDYAIDQRNLSFKNEANQFRGDFEFMTYVYDANGTLLNRTGSTMHADFTPTVYANFLRHPLSFNQDISVPRTGELFLRVAVHDINTGHIGAVEIPVDSVSKLPPLAASAEQ